MPPSAACALCGHPTEAQGHTQCLLPGLQEALIRAHSNMAQRLWKGIEDSTKGRTVGTEQTVVGLQGRQQPEEQIDAWQRAWDVVNDLHLEGEEVQADADMAARRTRLIKGRTPGR